MQVGPDWGILIIDSAKNLYATQTSKAGIQSTGQLCDLTGHSSFQTAVFTL